MNSRSILLSVAALGLFACNVSSTASPTHGIGSDAGTSEEASMGDAATDGDAANAEAATNAEAAAACDRGTVVVLSDYTSTQIALSALDGTTLSASFLSTASTKASALAFPLGGDVVVPSSVAPSKRVVLLDRFGTNVLTWADPLSGNVLGQLSVATGFESNPQDYVELGDTKAYISRSGVNNKPGAQPFDSGSDVLIVDTHAFAITGSISIPAEDSLPPNPGGMIRIGDTVVVVLQRLSQDFSTQGEAELVGLTNDAIAWQTRVTGLKNCGRPALSPSGSLLALGCAGQLDATGNADVTTSAIALLDVTSLPPKLVQKIAIVDQLGAPTQDGVSFATENLLLGKTQTALGGASDNQAFSLDLTSGKATVLLTAGRDAQGKGKGLVYGDVRCSPCGHTCLLADGDLGVLQRWSIDAEGLHPQSSLHVETTVGLPPVGLGGF